MYPEPYFPALYLYLLSHTLSDGKIANFFILSECGTLFPQCVKIHYCVVVSPDSVFYPVSLLACLKMYDYEIRINSVTYKISSIDWL